MAKKYEQKKRELASKALDKVKKGTPISSFRGKHKFVNSETKKEYKGGVYGGMDIHEAMEFEKNRKKKNG